MTSSNKIYTSNSFNEITSCHIHMLTLEDRLPIVKEKIISTIHVLKTESPVNTKLTGLRCGVGENRTLVQTSNQRAFYTFILFLGFRL